MLVIEDLSPLIEIANQYPLALEIFEYSWTSASTLSAEVDAVRQSINRVMPHLVVIFRDTDAVTLISLVGNVLPKLDPEVRWSLFVRESTLTEKRLYHKTRTGSAR